MPTMSATRARQEFFPLIERVNRDHDVVRVAAKSGTAVIISEVDYDAWQTTLHLLSTPANAAHLSSSLKQWRDGKARRVDLSILDQDDS